MNFDDLGMRLRRAREYARMSQSEAAEVLGVTPAALSQYESGKRRIDAMSVDRLSRLYAVSLRSLFREETQRPDWEESLRARSEELSPAGKSGISQLIVKIRHFEDLYRYTETPFPGIPHPPFQPLDETTYGDREAALFAERARRHYDLGTAPLPELRDFIEAHGLNVFGISLGDDEGDLSGLFFIHPEIGPIIATNEQKAFTRRPFTLAHELAHAFFHYDRPAILCRSLDHDPLERFADRFASHFLVPREALFQLLAENDHETATQAEQVVHLARYFGVSYGAMCQRLRRERKLNLSGGGEQPVAPVALARRLGYNPSPYEFGQRPLPPEERFPRVFLDLANQAIRDGVLSIRRVAGMLAISDIELEERLDPVMALAEEPEETYAF